MIPTSIWHGIVIDSLAEKQESCQSNRGKRRHRHLPHRAPSSLPPLNSRLYFSLGRCCNGRAAVQPITVSLRVKGAVMCKNATVRHVLCSILSKASFPTSRETSDSSSPRNLKDIRDLIIQKNVAVPARARAFVPQDVAVPAGNTGTGPGKKGLPGLG